MVFVSFRLPNVSIFNGGDKVPANEREDAERAFIRFYMELPSQDRPARYQELVAVHGQVCVDTNSFLNVLFLRPERPALNGLVDQTLLNFLCHFMAKSTV